MRLLSLYLRSRQVPAAVGAAFAATGGLWLVGVSSSVQARPALSVLAIGFGVAVFGTGLGGADPDLDRTAALRWPPLRAAHVLGVVILVAAAVIATGLAPAEVVLRNAFGLGGLMALGAAVLGRQLSWCFPLVWAGAASVLPPMAEPAVMQVLTWPAQPSGSTTALVAGLLAGIVGLLSYAGMGSRR